MVTAQPLRTGNFSGLSAVSPRDTSPRGRWLLLVTFVALAAVLLLAVLQDFYGNTERGDIYGSDAVQYLDIARAMQRHDWQSALNPLWSQGYPAVLAVARPLFPAGTTGDWENTRAVNLAIFVADLLAFMWLLRQLGRSEALRESVSRTPGLFLTIEVTVFVVTQLCLGEPSRVNPDELVNALFFCTCATVLALLRKSTGVGGRRNSLAAYGALLGLLLGVGFLVKAIFLVLGLSVLAIASIALFRRRRPLVPVFVAAGVFGVIVLSYGAALSRVTGHLTLGDAGPLNYAWHVNRLQKWVHWEGGVAPAGEAWPRESIARFVRWSTQPPDFGRPLHPSAILQASPKVYGFRAPFRATYTPYYDPPYWYAGFRPIVRARYQLVALGKSFGDLAVVFVTHPGLLAMAAALFVLVWPGAAQLRSYFPTRGVWPLAAIAASGVCLYLPVHLEGRYLAAFLAVLFLVLLSGSAAGQRNHKAATALLLCGLAIQTGVSEAAAVKNALRRRRPSQNVEWQIGQASANSGLPPGAAVGVISWTPSLHCDWAYIAHLQIQAEIAAPADYDSFWNGAPQVRRQTLQTFRNAGLTAVFTADNPRVRDEPGWVRLRDTPMWMYRLQ